MAKPKLCLIPATIGDKVYSILPSDGVGDFDFTRADGSSPTGITRINAQGLIEEVASGENRLNYSLLDGKVVGCPHLLLEPQSTNIVSNSNDFTSWSFKTGISVLSNQIISVDGALNGSKIETTANGSRYVGNNYTLSTGNNTFSVFAKKGVNNWVYLNVVQDGSNNWNYTFNLENGSLGQSNSSAYTVTPKIEYYGNGWYRCSITANVTSAGVFTARIYSADSATDVSTLIGANIYIFGAQLEEQSYATSYIATSGSTVTRAAETCNGSGDAATFNDSEGVLMAEISALNESGGFRDIRINDGTSNNRVAIRYSFTTNEIEAYVVSNGTETFKGEYVSQSIVSFNKIAVKYKENDFSFFVNGFELAIDTSGAFPIGLDNINFSTSSFNFYGKTKQIQYFDSALSDTELEQLTSWDSFRAMAEGQLYTIE